MLAKIGLRGLTVSSLALSTLVGMGQMAEAVTFEGTASATFGTPTSSTGSAVFSGVGTDTFTSGVPSLPADSSNIFTVDGLPFSTLADTPFAVADLTYTNGVTLTDTDVDSVPVELLLDFNAPDTFSEAFTFTFDLDVTLNSTGDPVLDADTLTVPDVFSTTTFTLGSELFTLEILGFSTDGVTINNVFTLPENATTTSQLFASITAPPPAQDVPESSPAALVLLGVGAAVIGTRTLSQR